MLNLVINCEGHTTQEIVVAAQEALRRIEAGAFSGSDRHDDVRFFFDVTADDIPLSLSGGKEPS